MHHLTCTLNVVNIAEEEAQGINQLMMDQINSLPEQVKELKSRGAKTPVGLEVPVEPSQNRPWR